MQGVNVEEVMNHAPVTIRKDQTVADLFALFQETHLQGFPVMANDEDLFGVVTLQDMERTLQKMEEASEKGEEKTIALKDIKVEEVATRDPVTVYPDEPIWVAIRKMAPRDLARLPVIARHGENKLIGQISRSDILRAYQMGMMRKQQSRFAMDRLALRPEGGRRFRRGHRAAGEQLRRQESEGSAVSPIHLHRLHQEGRNPSDPGQLHGLSTGRPGHHLLPQDPQRRDSPDVRLSGAAGRRTDKGN